MSEPISNEVLAINVPSDWALVCAGCRGVLAWLDHAPTHDEYRAVEHHHE